MRGAGRSAARQAGAPLIRLGFASTPSPTRGEGEPLHRHGQSPSEILRTRKRRASPSPTRGEGEPLYRDGQSPSEILQTRKRRTSPSPPVGEGGRAGAKRRRGRMRGAGRSARLPGWNTPHPPSLRLRHLLPQGEKGNRFIATANHHLRFCGRENAAPLLLPQGEKGGTRWGEGGTASLPRQPPSEVC